MDTQIEQKIEKNLEWQDKLQWDFPTAVEATGEFGVTCLDAKPFIEAVKKFQRRQQMVVDGIVGPKTWQRMKESLLTERERAVKKIVDKTVAKESGGNYCAMNRDGEYRGHFPGHRAEGEIHIGLSFGLFQFSQDGGQLGRYLQKCAEQNRSRFESIMGPTWNKLLDITTRPGSSGLATGQTRGPRVEKVAVKVNGSMEQRDLWEDPWVEKFQKLCKVPEFQKVQRELAEQDYLEHMLEYLNGYDLKSEKMVATAFSGAIHRGVAGMQFFMQDVIDNGFVNESKILERIVEKDPDRFTVFLEDDDLSWDEWKGFKFFN